VGAGPLPAGNAQSQGTGNADIRRDTEPILSANLQRFRRGKFPAGVIPDVPGTRPDPVPGPGALVPVHDRG
jgi:hypothetical protein